MDLIEAELDAYGMEMNELFGLMDVMLMHLEYLILGI